MDVETARGGTFSFTVFQVCNIASKTALCWHTTLQGQTSMHTHAPLAVMSPNVCRHVTGVSLASMSRCRLASAQNPLPWPCHMSTHAVPCPGHRHSPSLRSRAQSLPVSKKLQQGCCSHMQAPGLSKQPACLLVDFCLTPYPTMPPMHVQCAAKHRPEPAPCKPHCKAKWPLPTQHSTP